VGGGIYWWMLRELSLEMSCARCLLFLDRSEGRVLLDISFVFLRLLDFYLSWILVRYLDKVACELTSKFITKDWYLGIVDGSTVYRKRIQGYSLR
jgi:hypothetical protein